MTLPTPLLRHSPLTSCITTMAAVVYLSYWSLCAIDGSDTFIKEQIRLTIGTLRSLSEIWPIAHRVLGQVRGVAKELYAARRTINSTNWEAVTGGEILSGIIEKQSTSMVQNLMDPTLGNIWSHAEQ